MLSTSLVSNMSRLLSSSLLLFLPFFSSISVAQTTLTVAAAADLSSLEPELSAAFQKLHPGTSVRFVTQASAALAQQIENGAPYDVFLSANATFVDRLSGFGNIEPKTVTDYAIGRVGALWRDKKPHQISDLKEASVRYVALPNPKLAPYGVAAQQALEHAGLWSSVRQKLVYGENVRQTLELFESGNADAVLTSASLLEGKHPDLIPASWHQPILQKAGIVAGSKNQQAAGEFLDFLASPAGQAVFAKYGFSSPGGRQ